ncbi:MULTISPECIES: preprotein translocase subunit YajC [unclassified Fusibacter]|uniref:preprotein translocase subunit YajC n=1 Tax=unclassified Fusibacter TaxID=2624464 RepID=UPI001011C6A6|nr:MULTISPECIES: preprotein translocase subunit YajC [unclassified Fusibacter]MCK8059060.1 preprotein translocase subunit YajC [Fusibacter sp. A2]NPE22469.1 preprotein translocase subunit YajC [Fusibacter sp. A1]RXV60573.1 preprotein translocase subunit YajC [Fusibacter sp. A1]
MGYTTILLYLAMIGGLWYFMIRPQKKRQNELKTMRDALAVGDEVVTIGGIVGKIAVVKEDDLHLTVGHNSEIIVVKKWAIGTTNK